MGNQIAGIVPPQDMGQKMNIVPPQGEHTATLIFLHGLGDNGWAEDHFKGMKLRNIKCVCPTAEKKPVTIMGGMTLPAWFNVLPPLMGEDEQGLRDASEFLNKIIEDEEKAGIPASRIMIGGYSQGGALALYYALSTNKKLAGVVAYATYLPLIWKLDQAYRNINIKDMAIFHGHGTLDLLVPFSTGEGVSKVLAPRCNKYTFHRYDVDHFIISPQILADIKKFFQTHLS